MWFRRKMPTKPLTDSDCAFLAEQIAAAVQGARAGVLHRSSSLNGNWRIRIHADWKGDRYVPYAFVTGSAITSEVAGRLRDNLVGYETRFIPRRGGTVAVEVW